MKHMIAAAAMMAMVFRPAPENSRCSRPGRASPGRCCTSLQRDVDAALTGARTVRAAQDRGRRGGLSAGAQGVLHRTARRISRRTPLNARTVATLDRDGYRIEKVMFESRPGFHVTGLLHLPVTPGPHPAVLVPCGHSANGKAWRRTRRADRWRETALRRFV